MIFILLKLEPDYNTLLYKGSSDSHFHLEFKTKDLQLNTYTILYNLASNILSTSLLLFCFSLTVFLLC